MPWLSETQEREKSQRAYPVAFLTRPSRDSFLHRISDWRALPPGQDFLATCHSSHLLQTQILTQHAVAPLIGFKKDVSDALGVLGLSDPDEVVQAQVIGQQRIVIDM